VMVTHSAHLAGKCDRILCLKSGRLHEDSEKL
jgi:predicted ABC-type transport system involved in lysophospholipase L1 biosynthesis ATPase subunit